MKFTKEKLDNNEKVYATCIGEIKGQQVFIGCSEGPGAAHAIGEDGTRTTIWTEPGGTMNFVAVPGRQDCFFATQKFLPVFSAADCTLNVVDYTGEGWKVTKVMDFPYLHRFEIFEHKGQLYFFGATLCTEKAFQQDWSHPGNVYCGKLNTDLEKPFQVRKLYEGITRNHGLCHSFQWGTYGALLIGGDEGCFSFEIPEDPMEDRWNITKVLPNAVSDVATCDIDGDGELEVAAIEPFHGNVCRIYKKIEGHYICVQSYEIEFGHVVWGGLLCGEPRFLLGWRRGTMELVSIGWKRGGFFAETVDEGTGPSQVSVKGDVILAANRQIDELAVYRCSR
ncbi:MAG: hypothetical protein LKE40_11620 [Spirochaetia bacterium]|jgi:hypothetical protein|nr:hypothetical protein [Spirochaetia bacterium]